MLEVLRNPSFQLQPLKLRGTCKCTLWVQGIVWIASPVCVYLNIYRGRQAESRLLQLVLFGPLAAILPQMRNAALLSFMVVSYIPFRPITPQR